MATDMTGPLHTYTRNIRLYLLTQPVPLEMHITNESAEQFIKDFEMGRVETYLFTMPKGRGQASFRRQDVQGYALGQVYPL